MEKKLDLRVIKTRAALTDALYHLMSEKSLNEITVTELCDRAVIRKATFYKHFRDKTELLVYMIQEMMRQAEENNEIEYDRNNPFSYYVGALRYLLEFIDGNDRFIGNVLRSDSGSYVCGILMEQIRRKADERLQQEEREDVRTSHAMLSATFAGAIVGCGIWWAKQEDQPDKETVIRQFGEFISRM